MGSIKMDVKKNFCLDRRASDGLDLQPMSMGAASDFLRGFALDGLPSPGFLCRWCQRQSDLRDSASEIDVCMVIMVLSEARGLSLFLILRGGIV
jgi:hypothetical protein